VRKKKIIELFLKSKETVISCPIKSKQYQHPRVYLFFDKREYVICPYCQNCYHFNKKGH